MHIEPWNDAYWLTELYVQPTQEEVARINKDSYLTLQYELYPEGERKDDKSVMIRIEDQYYTLSPDVDIPTGTLDVPQSDLEELRMRNPPERRPVFVVEPWFQDYLSWEMA
jgi:hypothetical protein